MTMLTMLVMLTMMIITTPEGSQGAETKAHFFHPWVGAVLCCAGCWVGGGCAVLGCWVLGGWGLLWNAGSAMQWLKAELMGGF